MRSILRVLMTVTALAVMASAQVPQAGHVIVVVEENHSYNKIIGSSAMPYLNSLANKYGLAVNYYGNTHPSIGNYLMMTTGQIITNSDGYSGTISANNLARAFLTAGVSWKSYAESLPSTGYTGGDKYPYAKHHNPFAYFTDVVNSSTEKNNLVPFTQFSQDLANGVLPRFSFVVPNMQHNMHDCPTSASCTDAQKAAAADNWLKSNIAPLLASAGFQKDGLLMITWDEGNSTDTAHGGGQVATVVIGPKVKSGSRSTTLYQHQSLLRTVLSALGASSLAPGAAASATPMSDLFGTSGSGGPPPPPPPSTSCTPGNSLNTVTICAPTDGSTLTPPMHLTAATASASAVNYIAVWIDGSKTFTTYSAKLDMTTSLAPGRHRVTVQAKNAAGTLFAKTIYVTAN